MFIHQAKWHAAVLALTVMAVLTLSGPAPAQDGGGYIVGCNLWVKAVLQPASGPVILKWKEVGTETTPSGDRVISGYFYADPSDFPYGNVYNPEVFVKVYVATQQTWANIAFNHVTVDNVDVYSAHDYSGSPQQTGVVTLNSRIAEQSYTGVSCGGSAGPSGTFDGTWTGTAISTTPLDRNDEPCGTAQMTFVINNSQVTGSALDSDDTAYNLTGTVDGSGNISAGIAVGDDNYATYSGTLNDTTGKGSGSWSDVWECQGTWSMTKQ